MNFQASVGINIECHRVSMVYLKRSLKGISLAGQAVRDLEKTEDADKAVEVAAVVNEFLHRHGIPSADIFLGIQRDQVILRYIELPLAVKENLRGTLVYEMERYIPLSVEDIYFDFQIVDEDRAAGKLKVLLAAARKAIIDPYLAPENRPGTGVSGIEINSTALVNCLSDQTVSSMASPRAFLLSRDGRLELGLVTNNRLTYSRCVATDHMIESSGRLVNDELDLLRKNMDSGPDSLEVILCGSNDALADLVRGREDFSPGSMDLSRAGLSSDLLAPAYGLALRGMQKTPMAINLLPLALRKKVSKTPYYAMFVLAGLLVLAVLGWGMSNVLHQRHKIATLESELEQLGVEVAAVNRVRDRVNKAEERIEALNTLRRRHVPALNLLRELSGEVPPDAWFNRFYIAGDKGDIEGYADSASALIPLLASSPLVEDVSFLSPITKDSTGQEKFRIGFNLR